MLSFFEIPEVADLQQFSGDSTMQIEKAGNTKSKNYTYLPTTRPSAHFFTIKNIAVHFSTLARFFLRAFLCMGT